jgi:adenine deaminase
MSATWPADAYREMSETAADLAKLQRRIRVGLGEEPGDLLLVNAQVVNVFTARVEPASIVIADGWIAGVGQENWSAKEVIDVGGRYVAPGWIDSHMHLESTLLLPSELSRLVVPPRYHSDYFRLTRNRKRSGRPRYRLAHQSQPKLTP